MTNDFVIEKGIPLPESRGTSRYPLSKMEVGDSFEITGADPRMEKQLRAAIGRHLNGRKFTCRKVGVQVFRIWRIK